MLWVLSSWFRLSLSGLLLYILLGSELGSPLLNWILSFIGQAIGYVCVIALVLSLLVSLHPLLPPEQWNRELWPHSLCWNISTLFGNSFFCFQHGFPSLQHSAFLPFANISIFTGCRYDSCNCRNISINILIQFCLNGFILFWLCFIFFKKISRAISKSCFYMLKLQ